MSSTRKCKRCGAEYHLIVSYNSANKNIRDFCPACIKKGMRDQMMKEISIVTYPDKVSKGDYDAPD